MGSTLRRTLIVVIILIVIGGGVWAVTRPKPVRVVWVEVSRGRVEATVANTRAGTTKAHRRAKVAPSTSGQVTRLPVREGDRVEEGQVLIELWNEDIKAELSLGRSRLAAAVARLEIDCLNTEEAEREAKRVRELHAEGHASEEELDRATTRAEVGRARCRAAESDTDVARSQISVAEAALDRTIIRAPFTGTVVEVNAELGEVVTPSPPGIPTPPAVEIIDTGALYVSAPIDEVDAPALRVGMPARISLDAFPDRYFPGQVRRVAPYVLEEKKQARTVEVEVLFMTDEEGLLPGYSADVEVVLEARDDVLHIPTEALLEGNRVLVFDSREGLLAERRVELGLSNWERTEIAGGLKLGERVVVSVNRPGVVVGARAESEPKPGAKTASP